MGVGTSGLGFFGKPGPEVVKDPSFRGPGSPKAGGCGEPEDLYRKARLSKSRGWGLCRCQKQEPALTRSEQQWERLICWDRMRAACSGPRPHLPPPERAVRPGSSDLRSEARRSALRTRCLQAPSAPTASSDNQRGPQSQGQPSTRSLHAHLCLGRGVAQPNFSPPPPGSPIRPVQREALAALPPAWSRPGWALNSPSEPPGKGRLNDATPMGPHLWSSFALEPRAI